MIVFFNVCFSSLQLLQYNSTSVPWEPDLLHVIEAVERRGVKELSQEAALNLRFLLTQVIHVHVFVHTVYMVVAVKGVY